jgi:hypothetical protein
MSWARTRRTAGVTALLAVAVVAAACDPGYGVSAVNRSGTAVVIRDGTDKWLLPAHSAGVVYATIGPPEHAQPIDYEVLDAASCHLLATQRVDFAKTPDSAIVVGDDGSVAVGSPDPSLGGASLAATDACPGPADGWGLLIVNRTAKALYIRTRETGEVAAIRPSSSGVAGGGKLESSTIELLDARCRVLDSVVRTGWGWFTGTIAGSRLTLRQSKRPPDTAPSYDLTTACGGS